jgi:putative hydrolase of the HAD superfamily
VPISIPGHVVVLDYGQVISLPQSEADRAAMVAAAGVDAEAFWRAYQAERRDLDRGTLSTTDYWARIGRACGAEWDLVRLQELWRLDIRGWTSANAETVALIGELADGGTRLALLSNAGPDYGGLFRFSPIGALFEQVFVSGELLLLKPEAAIYEHVADALGIPLDRMVFVDDRDDNVAGAEALGVRGHVFRDAGTLRTFLTDLAKETA